MKWKNNKGITLIELIVSIALITIVIMFLFRLMVDVQYSENNTDFNRANQQTRAIIIKTIQQDFLDRVLIGVKDNTNSDTATILDFQYQDGTNGELIIEEDALTYTIDRNTEKWPLEKQNESTRIAYHCVEETQHLNDGHFFTVRITIPVVVNNNSKNVLDDIELFYIGDVANIENITAAFPSGFLKNYDANTCG